LGRIRLWACRRRAAHRYTVHGLSTDGGGTSARLPVELFVLCVWIFSLNSWDTGLSDTVHKSAWTNSIDLLFEFPGQMWQWEQPFCLSQSSFLLEYHMTLLEN